MSLLHRKDPQDGPLPSLAHLDYDATLKFLEAIQAHCEEKGLPLDAYYDWAIHVLLTSLMDDSAARMFLPRTETAPFHATEFFPFFAVEPAGSAVVDLPRAFAIAPLWNNQSTFTAIEDAAQGKTEEVSGTCGMYIQELNLAILTHGAHHFYFERYHGRGQAMLYTYHLKDLAAVIDTDGDYWLVKEEDGAVAQYDVLEPRMAALYHIAVQRFV